MSSVLYSPLLCSNTKLRRKCQRASIIVKVLKMAVFEWIGHLVLLFKLQGGVNFACLLSGGLKKCFFQLPRKVQSTRKFTTSHQKRLHGTQGVVHWTVIMIIDMVFFLSCAQNGFDVRKNLYKLPEMFRVGLA